MSWWSDGEPFDEYEGCARCNFNDDPSRSRCENCKSGDYWNCIDWDKFERENAEPEEELAPLPPYYEEFLRKAHKRRRRK